MEINFPNWIDKAIKLRENGLSYENIAKELKVGKKTVSFYLKQKGYGPNEKYIRPIQNQPNKKYFDENSFEIIDSEEKAYWLGFMYADGAIGLSIDNVELYLQESDITHIEKFKKFLKSEHKIGRKVKRKNGKEYVSYRLCICSKKLKNDLINKGCVQQKSLVLKYPDCDQVPLHLQRHFIRGYVDGDGCIRIKDGYKNGKKFPTIEIVGTENFLKGIVEYFGYDGHIYCMGGEKWDERTKRISLNHFKAYEVINEIYRDCDIALDRKYEIYKHIAVLR